MRPLQGSGGEWESAEKVMTKAWELVLSYLAPDDVARCAACCSSLADVARHLSARRAADASQGTEGRATIPFVNDGVDNVRYAYFRYLRTSVAGKAALSRSIERSWGADRASLRPARQKSQEGLGPTSAEDHWTVGHGRNEAQWDQRNKKRRRRKECSAGELLQGTGCMCRGGCDPEECPCGGMVTGELAYDELGLLKELAEEEEEGEGGGGSSAGVVRECGDTCACGRDCPNRVSQGVVRVALKVVRHKLKGWALHAAESIPRGAFVCEYAGEFVTTEEARLRTALHDDTWRATGRTLPFFLLVAREHLPSGSACLRVNIDPANFGNVARFANHACAGGDNLAPYIVRYAGSPLPKVALFARRDIGAGEELTFTYGGRGERSSSSRSKDDDSRHERCLKMSAAAAMGGGGAFGRAERDRDEAQPRKKMTGGSVTRSCYCGSPWCEGSLPCEAT